MSFLARIPTLHPTPRVHQSILPHWLTHLGALGLFSVAVIDSSVIPLPLPGSTDLLLLWLVSHNGNPLLLASMSISGSLLGGYVTWNIGRKGGEAALHRHVPARILKLVIGWVKQHPVLAVFLPAILPPPIPLSPFVLASGALGVSRNRFFVVFGAARTLRYSLITLLGVVYGRHVIRLWSAALQTWSAPLLWVFGGMIVAGICFGIWKVNGLRKSDVQARRKSRHTEILAD
jgi:membrane protein YqaA with SNARE-associated domain